jgi:hypothetical protein
MSHNNKRKSGMPLNQAPATAIPRPPGALEKLFWLADQNRPIAIAAEVGKPPDDRWAELITEICTSHFYYHQIVC